MMLVLRAIGGTVAGLAVALVVVVLVEVFSAAVYPTPADFDGSMTQMGAHTAAYPFWVLFVCTVGWAGASYGGTAVAKHLGGWVAAGLVGVLLAVATAYNVSMLPYPTWFEWTALPVVVVSAVAAGRLTAVWQPTAAEPPEGA